MPEKAEELVHARPFPAAVRDVLEASFIHRGRSFRGIREMQGIRKRSVAETIVERQFHPPHPRQQLYPWQQEPKGGAENADPDPSADEIEEEEARDQEHDRP